MSLNPPSQAIDAKLWSQFCDILKQAGDQILRPEAPVDEFNRAEGFRYLTRLLRIALDMYVESGDVRFPTFYRPSHETAKIGADNPDNYYQRAQIDGRYDYRIRGKRGTVHYLGFGTQAGGYSENGRNESTGFIDSRQLHIGDDGSFEIILSSEPKPGNWLPMTPASNTVIVRQTFLNRDSEQIADITIERIGAEHERPAPLVPEEFTQKLLGCAAFVEGTARVFANWTQSFLAQPNQLPPADQEYCRALGGDPNIFYYHAYWKLAIDEALVIDIAHIPECETWNFQLDNYWMESLDYRYHRIHFNKHTARANSNGSVTLIVAARDPGALNYIETADHLEGTMCFRWIRASEIVQPQCRVVKIAELESLNT
jgi:hypothetical protein